MILELLKKVITALDQRNISYMLSGSVAMNTYTVPRMTRDIDIVIHLKLSDIDKFAEIFSEGFYIYKEGIEEEVRRKGMFNIIDFQSGQKIDFIVRKDTDFHLTEFERRRTSEAYGFPVWIVSVEDLIISKLFWIQVLQSDTQMRDIQNLLEDNEVDLPYIHHWIKKLGLLTFGLL